ncbi:molybdate ABC transporter substrate-binding protein [Bradyrhizobium sp. cf659]|uniref:molybdate ABC transporter substrate-binding protein n=1 Tax=Bradyrhizobium sp. cf659 TaxID=1761771 RepID=UPI0008EF86B0|nr:substrate-binding domain-containing protein [Bradyrhizobium sp. cf659]SFI89971.1 molybdate transport system substrate-binding protein [Bradyrhizobium sp. cf659]
MRKSIVAALIVSAAYLGPSPAAADEIVVFSTPSLKPVLDHLGPKFEGSTRHTLKFTYAAVAALKREIDGGAAFDVALLLPAAVDDLIKEGKAARASRTDLAVALVGVAVRKGLPRPDISSPDALRRSLLATNSAAYGADSASGKYFLSLIDRLGIGPQMQTKLKTVSGNPVEAVARGDADLTVITVPNIVTVQAVEFAGVLPSPLQNVTTYTAMVSAAAENSAPANAFVQYLNSADATAAFIANGLQRPAP